MKSKLTRMKPEELLALNFKDAKMLLKKDLEILQTIGTVGTSFYLCTEFDFKDKKGVPVLVVGELKGDWKKYVKQNTKPDNKNTAVGTCVMTEDGKTLTLNIERGKAKPKLIEKAFTTGAEKIIPSTVNSLIFNETPKLEADDEIDNVDELPASEAVNPTSAAQTEDIEFQTIIAETKNYKSIAAENFNARLEKIKQIEDLIIEWEKKNMPLSGNKQKEERFTTLKKLRGQLLGHKTDLSIQNRQTFEPIDNISSAWDGYKKRPAADSAEALSDTEDRIISLADIKEKALAWYKRNPSPYCKEEEALKLDLDKICAEIASEEQKLKAALPDIRKAYVKSLFEKLTKASPEQKDALKKDELFLWELSRVVPVAQTNDARKLLGLEALKEEKESDQQPDSGELDMLKDPEIQKLFQDFAKFSNFEANIDHRSNPKLEKKIKLVAGVLVWEEGKGAKSKFALTADFTFDLISEDKKGNLRLKYGEKFYYSVRNANTLETNFKVLSPETPLFPEKPSKSHVIQGSLGDCYLLATLSSLADNDSNAIIDMMMDKGDTVTVRLFDVKADPKDPKKRVFKAKYINVEKSVPVLGNDDFYAKNYLWVQMIEKAYAAGKFSGTFDNQLKNSNSKGNYQGMESGFFAYASEVLTGKQSEYIFYMNMEDKPKDFVVLGVPAEERGKDNGNEKVSTAKLPWSTSELKIFKGKNPKLENTLAYSIFSNNLEKTVKWSTYVKSQAIELLFGREYSGNYSGEPTLEDFELLFQGKMKDEHDDDVTGLPVLDTDVAKEMLDWLKAKAFYPGKRGSGVYSVLQLSLFKEIQEALKNRKIVGLSSKAKVGWNNEGVGHSGGEAISGGLVGGHAYSVLDTNDKNIPFKELEIRNPWGKTVQRNVKVSERIVEIEKSLKEIISKFLEPVKNELAELKSLIEDIKVKIEAKAAKDKKKVMKEQFDLWVIKYKNLIAKRDEYTDLSDLSVYLDKIGKFKEEYQKGLKAIAALKKKDQNEIISTEEENLQESGEFWLFLDDLTKRFRRVHIG